MPRRTRRTGASFSPSKTGRVPTFLNACLARYGSRSTTRTPATNMRGFTRRRSWMPSISCTCRVMALGTTSRRSRTNRRRQPRRSNWAICPVLANALWAFAAPIFSSGWKAAAKRSNNPWSATFCETTYSCMPLSTICPCPSARRTPDFWTQRTTTKTLTIRAPTPSCSWKARMKILRTRKRSTCATRPRLERGRLRHIRSTQLSTKSASNGCVRTFSSRS